MWFSSRLRSFWSSSIRDGSRSCGSARKTATFRPGLETLEDRCLLSFGSPISIPVNFPTAMVTADVNGDRIPDLICVSNGGVGISVFLGQKKGGFAYAGFWPATRNGTDTISALAVGDFNGDGKPDIVAGIDPGDGSAFGETPTVSVLFGTGTGSFPTFRQADNLFSNVPSSLAVGDFNGNGKPDIVAGFAVAGLFISGPSLPLVSVALNTGGQFTSSQDYNVTVPGGLSSFALSEVAVGDFNGDGKPDIAATSYSNGSVSVFLNKGDGTGTFGAEQVFAVGGSAEALAVGDVNGDGKLDIVTANGDSNSVSVLLGKGDGTFGTAQVYATGGSANSIALGDFNKDRALDIVITGTELDVLLNNGDGTFAAAQKVGSGGSDVVVADFNGDGFPDLAQIDASGANIDVLINEGNRQKHR